MQMRSISLRQAFVVFILMLGSCSIRLVPSYIVDKANQAAWISIFFAAIAFIAYLLVMQKIFGKEDKLSFIQIIERILGKFAAKILGTLYFVYISVVAAVFIRSFGERMSAALSISTSYIVYIGILLVFLSFVMQYDIVVLARVSEILIFAVVVPYLIVCLLAMPGIKLSNFYPITYFDFLPVLQGSLCILSLWAFYICIFVFSNRIRDKKKLFLLGYKSILLLSFLTFFAIGIPLGIFGSATKELHSPFTASIQTISFFGSIERLESLIIAIWIMTDYVFISVFIFSGLHLLKDTFRLTTYKPLINVYIVLLFFLSVFVVSRAYEVDMVKKDFFQYANLLFGYGIPILLFIVGKIRKKI